MPAIDAPASASDRSSASASRCQAISAATDSDSSAAAASATRQFHSVVRAITTGGVSAAPRLPDRLCTLKARPSRA